MGQAKRKGTLEQRQHRATQRQWLEDIKNSDLNQSNRKIVSVSERFDWLEIPKIHTPPMRSSSMSKIKNFKPNNHRR